MVGEHSRRDVGAAGANPSRAGLGCPRGCVGGAITPAASLPAISGFCVTMVTKWRDRRHSIAV